MMNAQRKPPNKGNLQGNLKLALILGAVALFFFASVILKRLWL